MSTNASSSASASGSAAGSQPQGLPSPTPTEAGEGRYGENITYHHSLCPNPYQLLYLFNSQHQKPLFLIGPTPPTQQDHSELQPGNCKSGLICVQLWNRIPELLPSIPTPILSVFSTDSDDKPMAMATLDPPSRNESPLLLIRPLNPLPTTPSFILKPLLILTLNRKLSTPSNESSLSTPSSSTPAVWFKPQVKENWPSWSQPPSMPNLPDELQQNNKSPPPTQVETLIDCMSALCVNWTTISPKIA
ncbi:hypothetical protein Moror_3150 [Moniliophthora roreri MCA 2997]|uniref:Uncharacterized protein n=1 Tax=Moniliophthora roreri (strain MCA 2997) TaxID=1381753 RepID=V2X7Y2_MONRO|nr:hypothetical protein Moror_3150 [Moniliophthora roreri MCA 2997]